MLQEGSLALQKGRLAQLGDQTLALQGDSSRLVSIYCQFSILAQHCFAYAGKMTISTKVLIISEHGNMESCSLLKKIQSERVH